MSMGAHPWSRVAQRFANDLMALLLWRFDESDAPSLASEPAPLQGVMKERALLMHDEFGTHTRLWRMPRSTPMTPSRRLWG